MTKKRSNSELEHLRGKLREVTKLNKQLVKRIGRGRREYEKLAANVDLMPVEEFVEDFEEPKSEAIKCDKCNKKVTLVELGNRTFYNCKACDFRKTMKR